MCTLVTFLNSTPRAMAHRVDFPVLQPDQIRERCVWLGNFENGTSGQFSFHPNFDTYSLRERPWAYKTIFWFTEPHTAFAFRMRWS
ncbi:MAG: hypothetical protein EOP83_10005 [Verrucomicrobiaceae bacterium]|nr:MAG: hypothetical protein EOP83_10005 [Verrucomicrobiaceae bacterium]